MRQTFKKKKSFVVINASKGENTITKNLVLPEDSTSAGAPQDLLLPAASDLSSGSRTKPRTGLTSV